MVAPRRDGLVKGQRHRSRLRIRCRSLPLGKRVGVNVAASSLWARLAGPPGKGAAAQLLLIERHDTGGRRRRRRFTVVSRRVAHALAALHGDQDILCWSDAKHGLARASLVAHNTKPPRVRTKVSPSPRDRGADGTTSRGQHATWLGIETRDMPTSWNPWTGPSTPDACAIVVLALNSHTSSACVRLQKRFRLLGTCTMQSKRLQTMLGPAAASQDMYLVTVWDCGNAEGDKLSPEMMGAMRLLLRGAGADKHGVPPQPGSIIGDCPEGTVMLGPVVDAALARDVVPQDASCSSSAPAPAASKSTESPAPQAHAEGSTSDAKGNAAAKAAAPKALNLSIQRDGKGVRVELSRRQPLVEVVLKRPAKPKGDWVTINVLSASSSAAASKPSAASGSKKAGKAPGVGGSSSNEASTAAVAAVSFSHPVAAGPVEPIRPTYRGTQEAAAMQQALRLAAGGFKEQAFLFHSGRPAWHQAVAATAQRS